MAEASTMKDLRALPEADLRGQLDKLRRELWQQKIKLREGALQQTHVVRQLRRQIARVSTVLGDARRIAAAGR